MWKKHTPQNHTYTHKHTQIWRGKDESALDRKQRIWEKHLPLICRDLDNIFCVFSCCNVLFGNNNKNDGDGRLLEEVGH